MTYLFWKTHKHTHISCIWDIKFFIPYQFFSSAVRNKKKKVDVSQFCPMNRTLFYFRAHQQKWNKAKSNKKKKLITSDTKTKSAVGKNWDYSFGVIRKANKVLLFWDWGFSLYRLYARFLFTVAIIAVILYPNIHIALLYIVWEHLNVMCMTSFPLTSL